MTTYRDRYNLVICSNALKCASTKEQVERLAQLIYGNDQCRDKEDCLVQALEEHEAMTGEFWDPTREEYDDVLASII